MNAGSGLGTFTPLLAGGGGSMKDIYMYARIYMALPLERFSSGL